MFFYQSMISFINSSTTSLHLIRNLRRYEGLPIITNGVSTVAMLRKFTSTKVLIVGGMIVQKQATINSSKVYNDVRTYFADLAIISCRGFYFTQGVTEIQEGKLY